jgi:uncharacterized membrane protein YfcA
MKKKIDRSKILKMIIMISAILFVVLGIAIMIFDQAYIKGIQYIITAGIYFTALNLIKNGKLSLESSQDKRSVNLNLGFIFTVGITSPLESAMFTMWVLGILLFLMGMFYVPKEKITAMEVKKPDEEEKE